MRIVVALDMHDDIPSDIPGDPHEVAKALMPLMFHHDLLICRGQHSAASEEIRQSLLDAGMTKPIAAVDVHDSADIAALWDYGSAVICDADVVTAAVLAAGVGADRLVVLTHVPALMQHFGTAQATAFGKVYLDELEPLHFSSPTMGPRIDACRGYVESTRHPAQIGAVADAAAVLEGHAGTTILDRRSEDAKMGRR